MAGCRRGVRRRGFSVVLVFALWPPILGLFPSVAAAHEGEDHGEPASHREAMRAVKEGIPTKFRDMTEPPLSVNEETIARGREVYREHCVVCHGEDGRGDGPAAAGMEPPPANFLDLEHSSVYSPGEKYWLVTHGAPETGMPGFSDSLDETERWSVVVYILSLQGKGGSGAPPETEKGKTR